MALRDVTIRWNTNETVGDETFETWLKTAGVWAQFGAGVVEQVAAFQDFTFSDLEEGVEYSVQVRMVRSGRYRSDYLSADPDNWPAQSLVTFTPGVADFDAPTINGTAWSRTGASAQRITVTATASAGNGAIRLELLRAGVIVDTQESPGAGAVDLVDADPPLGATHSYTVRHATDLVVGTQSAPSTQFAGPPAPTGLTQLSGGFYTYRLAWDAPPSGAATEYADDYLCPDDRAIRATTVADAVDSPSIDVEKESAMAPNGNTPASFTASARHLVEAFGTTDEGAWADVTIDLEIASDETAFQSCP